MVWLDSSPTLEAPYVEQQTPISVHSISIAPLFIVLTKTSVSVYHQYTLLPLAIHERSPESLKQHGYNSSCEIQVYAVNYSKLQQATNVNIVVNSSNTHLILYLLVINYSTSFFQVLESNSDELLQKGLPLLELHSQFSLRNLIKAASRTFSGNEQGINLENIEHFSNAEQEDELNNFIVPYVKISVLKVLKISIGIENFWLKHNSHNLLIFSHGDLQIINIKLFNNEVRLIQDFDWYAQSLDSKIKYIQFNEWFNYFLFINDLGEVWFMTFQTVTKDAETRPPLLVGTKTNGKIDLDPSDANSIVFNPQFNLFLVRSKGNPVKLYKVEDFESTDRRVTLIKTIITSNNNLTSDSSHISNGKESIADSFSVSWSPCGAFFTLIEENSGNWQIFSKFGKCTFNSAEISKELTITQQQGDSNFKEYLTASKILVTPNSCNIILIDANNTKMYSIDLLTNYQNVTGSGTLVFSSKEYISILDSNSAGNNLHRFPIPPLFKGIMRKLTHAPHSDLNITGIKNILPSKLQILANLNTNQLSLSHGDNISISTPYKTNGKVNHVLWFHFHNYFNETLNIVDHFWNGDFLILINRTYKNSEIDLVDEIIILNVAMTKFANGGVNVKFDSEMTVWRYDLKQTIICQKFQENDTLEPDGSKSSSLVVITNELKILIFKFSYSSKTSPPLFIGISRTIFLKTIAKKLLVRNITQIDYIENKHFLFLMNTGDLYLLKNHDEDVNGYDLVLINGCVEYLKFKSLFDNNETFMYLFTGSSILIFKLADVIKSATSSQQQKLVIPIIIMMNQLFQPLLLNCSGGRSIFLVGLENFATYKSKYLILKNRINHNLILNNFIEYDIFNEKEKLDLAYFQKYEEFENFHYCLELLLFKYLTEIDNEASVSSDSTSSTQELQSASHTQNTTRLKSLINLINSQPGTSSESIYINCLRKIEVGYWYKFFDTLDTTPLKLMNKLIFIGEVELCYNYLIIYLNFKKEYEAPAKEGTTKELLDLQDQQIILSIIKLLDKAERWDWCFELCRFIKLLEPTSELLKLIQKEIDA